MKLSEINLSEYKLVQPESIQIIDNEEQIFYDIEVEDVNTFYIRGNNGDILSHNCDGLGHIASLLINLFYKWFPDVINQERLYILITPLLSAEFGGKLNYFMSYEDYDEFKKGHKDAKFGKVRYLKGLGSLSLDDWEWVMEQRRMFKIYNDKSAGKYMDIAFGTSSDKRKKWLQGTYDQNV